MSRSDPMLRVRLPQPLKDRLHASAEANLRTLNAEIVFHLNQSLPGQKEKNRSNGKGEIQNPANI